MEKFGLIGFPLGHSYSKKYFTEKFETLGLNDHIYDLIELEFIKGFPTLWANEDMRGMNVTVPHKEHVIEFLDELDSSAQKVGAVNVIKREHGQLRGYNTDYLSFKESLENWLPNLNVSALVLGSGGSSKAIQAALKELKIDHKIISRQKAGGNMTYEDIKQDPEILKSRKLLINTTPLGTHPNTAGKADIPYEQLTEEHFLYDLVYNPEVTAFMAAGQAQGAKVKNGLEMLRLQAEKSWEIWTKK